MNSALRNVVAVGVIVLTGLAHAGEQRNMTISRSDAPAADQRIALVIGNSGYKSSPLVNPVNDARAISAKLRTLGFTVIERQNLTFKQIGPTLREFRSKLTPGAVALFFYAGHGLQVKGSNYLPVVDADIAGEEDVSLQSLEVSKVLELMDEAKTRLNLIFLDACRNNPYARSFRSAADGLAKIDAPSGTLISFATRPGSVAADGTGRNGLYTEKLLAAMSNINQPIEQVLKRVVSSVKIASNGRQEPWMEGSIEGDFCFARCGATALAAPTTEQVAAAAELTYWEAIKDSANFRDFDAYLEKYPNGQFADIARIRGGNWGSDAKGCRILLNGSSKTAPIDSLTWDGECLNGKANGSGKVEVTSGGMRGVSDATYRDGVPIGISSAKVYKDDKLYMSREVSSFRVLDNGDFLGNGKTSMSDGSTYEGTSVNGVPDGIGTYIDSNGTKYEGSFSKGKRNGPGKLTGKDGSVIEGTFDDNKCGPNMKIVNASGATYVGEVSADCKGNGYGVQTTREGHRFEGKWVAGQFLGK